MAMDYETLYAELLRYTRDDDPDNVLPQIPSVIKESEQLLSNIFADRAQYKSAAITLLPGAASVPVPSGWRSTLTWSVTDQDGSVHVIARRTLGYLRQMYPDAGLETARARPTMWALAADGAFAVAPRPHVTLQSTLEYVGDFSSLTPGGGATELSTRYPEILRVACLTHYAVIHKSQDMRQQYEARLQSLLQAAGTRIASEQQDLLSSHYGRGPGKAESGGGA